MSAAAPATKSVLSDAVQRIKPSATIAAGTKAKELKAAGHDVLSFTLGEPDFTTPQHICDAAKAAMDAGDTHYTAAAGTLQVKQAVCDLYARFYGLEYDPPQCVVSNGAKHSIHNVLTALCGPGDEVIIPTPYWVSYSDLVGLTGAKPVFVETTVESGWVMSPEQFESAITPSTKLLMLNSPTNPTGATYPPETLEQIARIAVERDIFVLSDEIYERLIYAGSEFRSFASFGKDVQEKTIIVSGVSKAYAMTGWRIGWALAPLEIAAGMAKLQSQETSCPSSISQAAAVAAVSGPQVCVEEMRLEFAERREYVLQRLKELPDLAYAEPGGAFYAFFDVSAHFGKPLGSKGVKVDNATDFCTALLEDQFVALVTGDAFGAPGYVRLSFATDLKTIEQGFDRITKFLGGA
ncbi:pyridoxal phosphate-dependent aminotransferase [Stratiformator vulcanicus]|uniref:Aminotransferase n=1 Tax=Stratiformator vulcanicus TaxID=2527980 RepID=A0A517R019_9PLAN|nr:pyridoxal phosphate-dependent aminotransferase [Stratiformator vulcanicus]QDT37239.1 Aspartate aminotransferase [Stratiformator vulcanicus]